MGLSLAQTQPISSSGGHSYDYLPLSLAWKELDFCARCV